MWAVLGAVFQISLLLLTQWFKYTDEKREKAKEILKDVKNAKDASAITSIFDRLAAL